MKCCKKCLIIFKKDEYSYCPYCKELLESYYRGDWSDSAQFEAMRNENG